MNLHHIVKAFAGFCPHELNSFYHQPCLTLNYTLVDSAFDLILNYILKTFFQMTFDQNAEEA